MAETEVTPVLQDETPVPPSYEYVPVRPIIPAVLQPVAQTLVQEPVMEHEEQSSAPAAEQVEAPPQPSAFQLFLQRWVFGGNPLVKVGVLKLFLGLAFLLRYAAEHAVLPIEWRYAGVATAGIGLLLSGWRWRHKKDNYGLILQGAGIAVLYLTTLAAMKLHPLIPPEFGFAVLIAVAAFAALLAILQDSLTLAVIGTLGGFAAPVLASTGGGNHIALFSYLTILYLGIVAIAWFKAWRLLNLIGYVGSFALGSGWAAKYYRDELFSTTEPFLLLLFVLYVLITFLFARRTLAQAEQDSDAALSIQVRQAAARIGYMDGTLAFGVPFSAFGLQYLLVKSTQYGAAFSALGFGLIYIALAFVLFRRTGQRYYLLTETMLAMGVIFGSLAIPLGLEQKWTSAAWAVEAAGMYWVGIRQQRLHARLFALLLLMGAAIYFALGLSVADHGPALDGSLLGCALLASSSWWTYRLMRQAGPQQLSEIEAALLPGVTAFGTFFTGAIPFLLWPTEWASPALALLGTAAVFASLRMAERPLLHWGWAYQALAGVLFMTTLHTSDGGSVLSNGWTGLLAAGLIGASMLAGVWVVVRQSMADTNGAARAGTVLSNGVSMALLGWMIAPVAYPWALTSSRLQRIWPMRDHQVPYRLTAAIPIVLYLLVWVWISNAFSSGAASPLPYVPLLNPLEVAHVAVLLGVTLWWWSLREQASLRDTGSLMAGITGATAFAVLTGSVVRTCHHWGQVAWDVQTLLASNLVQTSLSVAWAALAIGLMLVGNRSKRRPIWIVGAVLIAVVVAKLFLVELAATGSLARIISFIVVGLLLLLVGYFAPLPPKRTIEYNPAETVST